MLGDQIKKLRLSRKLTQVEFANILNVSKQSVSNWEHNTIMPSVDIIRNIAVKFDVSSDYLLELDDRLVLDVSGIPIATVIHVQQILHDFRKLYLKEDCNHDTKI